MIRALGFVPAHQADPGDDQCDAGRPEPSNLLSEDHPGKGRHRYIDQAGHAEGAVEIGPLQDQEPHHEHDDVAGNGEAHGRRAQHHLEPRCSELQAFKLSSAPLEGELRQCRKREEEHPERNVFVRDHIAQSDALTRRSCSLTDLHELWVHLVERDQRRKRLENPVGYPTAMAKIDGQIVEPAAEPHFLLVRGLAGLIPYYTVLDAEPYRTHPAYEEQVVLSAFRIAHAKEFVDLDERRSTPSAADQGRDVMAVPGTIVGGRNRGANALLRDGAKLVESAVDILADLGIREDPSPTRCSAKADGGVGAGGESSQPVDFTVDQVADQMKIPGGEALALLLGDGS